MSREAARKNTGNVDHYISPPEPVIEATLLAQLTKTIDLLAKQIEKNENS